MDPRPPSPERIRHMLERIPAMGIVNGSLDDVRRHITTRATDICPASGQPVAECGGCRSGQEIVLYDFSRPPHAHEMRAMLEALHMKLVVELVRAGVLT